MAARRFPRGGVASPHYLASTAGLATLARGGNALDAAIAANLALGVVAPYLCGYGGDVFAIVWDGELHGYLGSGRSPRAATIDAVRDRAQSDTMPYFGPHSVTVPGAVAGWFDLLDRWGTRSFGDLADPALGYARDGFELTQTGAAFLGGSVALYEGFPALRTAYQNVEAGQSLRQPGLARTIDTLAADGPDAYYRGPIADAIAESVQSLGGLLSAGHVRCGRRTATSRSPSCRRRHRVSPRSKRCASSTGSRFPRTDRNATTSSSKPPSSRSRSATSTSPIRPP